MFNPDPNNVGWKLVYGDVFRPPQHSTLFAAIIGSGIQILLMLLVVLFCAAMGKNPFFIFCCIASPLYDFLWL